MSDDEGRRETDEEAVIRGLIEHEVNVPEPDDDTCRRYYERNRARFRSADIYEAAHILFAALPADREAHAQARADAVAVLASCGRIRTALPTLARAFALHVGRAGRQSRPDHNRADDAGVRAGARRACARPTVRSAGRDALRLPHHPPRSQARGPERCPMRWSPAASPITCARACGGGPMRNTSRGWYRRRGSRASILPAPTRCACIEEWRRSCSVTCWPD